MKLFFYDDQQKMEAGYKYTLQQQEQRQQQQEKKASTDNGVI